MAGLEGFDWGAVIQFCTALATLVTAIIAWRTRIAVAKVNVDMAATQANVLKIEQATNSMKDALVEATGKAEFGRGVAQGREEEKSGISPPVADAPNYPASAPPAAPLEPQK
jgi:hypothetical protein